MKTCKTCRHWKRIKPLSYEGLYPFGNCSNPSFVAYGKCKPDGASFWDRVGDAEVFFDTGEDFGCIHYRKATAALVMPIKPKAA